MYVSSEFSPDQIIRRREPKSSFELAMALLEEYRIESNSKYSKHALQLQTILWDAYSEIMSKETKLNAILKDYIAKNIPLNSPDPVFTSICLFIYSDQFYTVAKALDNQYSTKDYFKDFKSNPTPQKAEDLPSKIKGATSLRATDIHSEIILVRDFPFPLKNNLKGKIILEYFIKFSATKKDNDFFQLYPFYLFDVETIKFLLKSQRIEIEEEFVRHFENLFKNVTHTESIMAIFFENYPRLYSYIKREKVQFTPEIMQVLLNYFLKEIIENKYLFDMVKSANVWPRKYARIPNTMDYLWFLINTASEYEMSTLIFYCPIEMLKNNPTILAFALKYNWSDTIRYYLQQENFISNMELDDYTYSGESEEEFSAWVIHFLQIINKSQFGFAIYNTLKTQIPEDDIKDSAISNSLDFAIALLQWYSKPRPPLFAHHIDLAEILCSILIRAKITGERDIESSRNDINEILIGLFKDNQHQKTFGMICILINSPIFKAVCSVIIKKWQTLNLPVVVQPELKEKSRKNIQTFTLFSAHGMLRTSKNLTINFDEAYGVNEHKILPHSFDLHEDLDRHSLDVYL